MNATPGEGGLTTGCGGRQWAGAACAWRAAEAWAPPLQHRSGVTPPVHATVASDRIVAENEPAWGRGRWLFRSRSS